ncbi:hypothetical protein Tco_0079998 [Tanacetum coccineum]
MIADIKYLTSIGPSDAINNLPSLASQNPLKRFLFHFSMEITPFSNNFSLRVSLVIEKSDTQVITVKMEVLLEPTSNNLMVDSILQAGNHVKEILLKLNLPDHKSILTDSKDNAFNGMNRGDVTNHIAKVLEITEWIKMPNVEKNELRLHVFSKSLSGDAETWWYNEINGTTITWSELNNKFFHKYHLLSHTCNSEIPDDLDNRTDYFEFIYWLALKFDNY